MIYFQPNIVRPHSVGAFPKVINLTQEPESSVGMPGTEDGSEPTLDINSATKGNRVVTVIEVSTRIRREPFS